MNKLNAGNLLSINLMAAELEANWEKITALHNGKSVYYHQDILPDKIYTEGLMCRGDVLTAFFFEKER